VIFGHLPVVRSSLSKFILDHDLKKRLLSVCSCDFILYLFTQASYVSCPLRFVHVNFSVKNCLMPVGVEDGRIPDEAFTASSSANAAVLPNRARLNLLPNGGKYCWAAGQNNANQWLQVWNTFPILPSRCIIFAERLVFRVGGRQEF